MQTELTGYKEKFEAKAREVIKVKDQRDSANREIAVLKASDTTKYHDQEALSLRAKSLDVRQSLITMFRTVTNVASLLILQERVEGLLLEVKRLKSQLAAQTGQADVLAFLLSNGGKEDVSFVQDLQSRLRSVISRSRSRGSDRS